MNCVIFQSTMTRRFSVPDVRKKRLIWSRKTTPLVHRLGRSLNHQSIKMTLIRTIREMTIVSFKQACTSEFGAHWFSYCLASSISFNSLSTLSRSYVADESNNPDLEDTEDDDSLEIPLPPSIGGLMQDIMIAATNSLPVTNAESSQGTTITCSV